MDKYISFKWLHNSHIIGAAQLELFLKDENGHTSKILYTSDLGSYKLSSPFVHSTELCTKANLAIFESTYGAEEKIITKKDRMKDKEKIKSIVNEVCKSNGGRILIPCFSLDRTQKILKVLYDIFKEDSDFNIPIIVDSPLSCKITDVYKEVLEGDDLDVLSDIINWKNVRFIKDKIDSNICLADKKSKIVIASSGFLQAGRSVSYLKEFLPNSKDMILFVGYASLSSLAYKIKNGNENKTISIEGKPYKNRCKIVCLNSFSSHIQRDEIIDYVKGLKCEKLYLVHGSKNAKLKLKNLIEIELEKLNKTTKVICVQKGMSVIY